MAKVRFASLTAGLLARKGEAHPAAESVSAMAGHAHSVKPLGLLREPHPLQSPEMSLQDELDWMTSTGPSLSPPQAPGSPPRLRTVPHASRAEAPSTEVNALLKRIGKAPVRHAETDPSPARRVAVTVRLDEARYLRLKLTGLRLHRTSQDLLTKALDAYLTALGVDPVSERDLQILKGAPFKDPA